MSDAVRGDAMLRGEAASPEVFGAVFDSPELLGIIAGYAQKNHLAHISALHRLNTTTRRNLALVMAAVHKLRLTSYDKETRIVSNDMVIVDTAFQHVTVRGMVERDPNFWPALHYALDEYPDVKILYLPGRSTWKGADIVLFLDLFTRLYPNRVLACSVGSLSPRAWYQAEWEVVEAHPAVKLGVVRLVEDVPARGMVVHQHTMMMNHVGLAQAAVDREAARVKLEAARVKLAAARVELVEMAAAGGEAAAAIRGVISL